MSFREPNIHSLSVRYPNLTRYCTQLSDLFSDELSPLQPLEECAGEGCFFPDTPWKPKLSKYYVIKCHREYSFSPCNKKFTYRKHHLVAKNHMDPGMFLFVLPPLHENDDNNVHEERTVTIMRMRLKTMAEIMPVLTCIE